MADRYWVGTGIWDDVNTANWSTSSGGASGASVPGLTDNVYLTALSGNCTISGSAQRSCLNFDCTGYTGTATALGAGNWRIEGGFKLVSGMTFTMASNWGLSFTSTSTNGGAGWPITTAGKTLGNVTFNGVGGKWTLQDALTLSAASITFTAGTFDTSASNHNVTAATFIFTSGTTKTLTLNGSTLTASAPNSTGWNFGNSVTGTTFTSNSATFVWSPNGGTAEFRGLNYNGLSLNLTPAGGFNFNPSGSTFNNVSIVGPSNTTTFANVGGDMIVTGTLTITGNSFTNRLHYHSNTLGTPRVITATAAMSFTDLFQRANSGTLGSPWTARNLGIGITSNAAYYTGGTTSDTAIATTTLGSADQWVEWEMSVWPKGPVQAMFRYVDNNNYWFVSGTNAGGSSGIVYLFKRVGGIETMVATQSGVTWGAGNTLRVEAVGTSIVVKVNGTTLSSLTTISSDLSTTGVHAGIGGYAGGGTAPLLPTARWTRFSLWSPGVLATSLTDVDFMDIVIVGPTGSTITSDSFNRANASLAGSTSDAATGGTGLVWTTPSTPWMIASNEARPTAYDTNDKFAFVNTSTSTHFVSAKIVSLPGVSAAQGVLARNDGTSSNYVIAIVNNTGAFFVQHRVAGSLASIYSGTTSFVAGDTIGMVVLGRTVVVYRNGTVVGVTQTTLTSGNYSGFYSSGANATMLDDFKVQVVPDVTGTRLGDCLGNSGIEFTTASGTTRDGGGAGVKRYAVAAGNWSSTSMWSETDGGSPGASVPLPQDDVYLTASSGAGTYTADMRRACRNLDLTGFTHTFNGNGSQLSFYGSTKYVNMAAAIGSTSSINYRGRGSHTITSAGWQRGEINIYAPGGTYTLTDDLTHSTVIPTGFNLYAGTLDTASYSIDCSNTFFAVGSLAKTLVAGTSTITARRGRDYPVDLSGTNTTLSTANATFVFATATASDRIFATNGATFGAFTCTVADSPGAIIITGSNTFGTLNIGSGRSLKLPVSTQTTVSTLNVAGVPRGGVRLPGVSGSYLSTPDSAAVSVTGDIDIRVRVALSDWTPASQISLFAKRTSGASDFGYALRVNSTGVLNLGFGPNSTMATNVVSTASPTVADGSSLWVRCTRNATTGSVMFFTALDSPTMPTSWTQLGATVVGSGSAIYDSTQPILFGTADGVNELMTGTLYRMQIRNNVLDDGTGIVFDTDFTNQFGPFFLDSANGAIVTPITTLANVGDGRVVIESSVAGSTATLQLANPAELNYVDLKDITINGKDAFIGGSSIVRTNVKGNIRSSKGLMT